MSRFLRVVSLSPGRCTVLTTQRCATPHGLMERFRIRLQYHHGWGREYCLNADVQKQILDILAIDDRSTQPSLRLGVALSCVLPMTRGSVPLRHRCVRFPAVLSDYATATVDDHGQLWSTPSAAFAQQTQTNADIEGGFPLR